jgi:hypothetical protein
MLLYGIAKFLKYFIDISESCGGHSVGIVCLQTKATEFSFSLVLYHESYIGLKGMKFIAMT